MFSLYSQTEHHLIILSHLIRQLEFLLLPPKSHFRKPNHIRKYLHLHSVVVSVLKTQRLTVEVFIMIRVTPPIAVQQVAPVPCVFVVVKLKFILFANSLEHHSYQHPRTHIKAGQLHEHFALGLAYFS